MTAPTIDHAAAARVLAEASREQRDTAQATLTLQEAQVHATLALAAARRPASIDPATAEALHTVAAAWNVEGRDPVEHHRAQADLRRTWPTLARAVELVARLGARS